MATRRRPDTIDNPGPLLAIMRTCRQAMISASTAVRPTGTTYQGLGARGGFAIDARWRRFSPAVRIISATVGGEAPPKLSEDQMAADEAMGIRPRSQRNSSGSGRRS